MQPSNTSPTAEQPGKPGTSRARGRPRAFDRDAALAQAMRLFWQKGFAATSMADLTQAMGIASPSLYAAFGSKEALYAEATDYYCATFGPAGWRGFLAADTAREAVQAWLMDAAALLSGGLGDVPLGCMVTLSAVGNEGNRELGEMVRAGRAALVARLKERIDEGVASGEIGATVDTQALARFLQVVQNGMSVQARDGVGCAELEAVARVAMLGWDGMVGA